ncbi:MAG: ATP-binding protein [Anaerolineae bacterium]|nr:ATP-binding protein [Anaerolineae bacterium]
MSFPFQNRDEPLQIICDSTSNDNILLDVYGEAGIGKSRLLQEARLRLQKRNSSTIVLILDIASLQIAADRPTALLQTLLDQAEGKLRCNEQSNEEQAESIVVQLNELAAQTPVYLMFDTTETLQDDVEFWDWVHLYITEPLVIERNVRQIYAGRVPVPWRRFELRRAVRLLPLGTITPVGASRRLVEQALLQGNPALKERGDFQAAIDVVLEFSFGHPLLSEKLAAYVASHWPPDQPLAQFKKTLCEQEVKKFINEFLFKGVEEQWIRILWWASVLDWFDPTILQEYLKHVMPELGEKPDYYFIQEVAKLRTYNRVIWQESRGDRLHGLIQDIVRQCFKSVDRDGYRSACLAAAETFESIAEEFSAEDSYAQQFTDEAAIYRQRRQSLEEMTK